MAELIQYVNLDVDTKKPRHGRVIKIKVGLEKKRSEMVFLYVKPGAKNKKSSDLESKNRAGINAYGTDQTAIMSDSDGNLEFDLVLSNYGGDSFSVEATTDAVSKSDLKVISDTFVVWKKLFYQVSQMKASYSFPFGKVKTEYESHFLELEETAKVNVPHSENLETHELKAYRKYFKKKEVPFEQHVVLIDRQCDSKTVVESGKMPGAKATLKNVGAQWPFPDWLAEATYNIGGADKKAGMVVTRVGSDVSVDLSGAGVDPTKVNVSVSITIKTLKGEYTGDASYTPHVFIAVGKKRSDSSKSKTVVHEIGHALGLVPSVGHDYHYENVNGGSGNHCRFGATPDKKSKAQGGAFSGIYENGKCVMYAYSSENYQFCDTCTEFVKEAALSSSNMKSRGWG